MLSLVFTIITTSYPTHTHTHNEGSKCWDWTITSAFDPRLLLSVWLGRFKEEENGIINSFTFNDVQRIVWMCSTLAQSKLKKGFRF